MKDIERERERERDGEYYRKLSVSLAFLSQEFCNECGLLNCEFGSR